jgi:hypothetical protein
MEFAYRADELIVDAVRAPGPAEAGHYGSG